MATRQDVANLAGVSVATVSYVMNRTKRVTPQVQKRVEDAIEQLNYRPNLLARGLSKRETRHVALLVDNLNNPYYFELLRGAQALASRNGYIVSVIPADESHKEDIMDLASRGLDGCIQVLPAANPAIQAVLPPDMPVVIPELGITLKFEKAFDEMAEELVRLGHREIAFLSSIPADQNNNPRFACWRRAMIRLGLTVHQELIVDGCPGDVADGALGMKAMEQLLSKKVPFTAVYAINDLMALGAMRTLHMRGYSVPGDVSVIGCDKLKTLEAITPSLATMDMYSYETGEMLMGSLIARIAGAEYKPVTIQVNFVPGESIGPAPMNRNICAAGTDK